MKPHKMPHRHKVKVVRRDDVIKIPGDVPEVLYIGRLFAMLNHNYTKVYEQMGATVEIEDAINYMHMIEELLQDIITTISVLYEKTNYYSSNYFYEPRVKDLKLIIIPKRLRGLRVLEDIYRLTALFKGHSGEKTINDYLNKLIEYALKLDELVALGYRLLKMERAYYPNKMVAIIKQQRSPVCGIVYTAKAL